MHIHIAESIRSQTLAWMLTGVLILHPKISLADTSSSSVSLAPAGQYIMFFQRSVQAVNVVDGQIATAKPEGNRLVVNGGAPGNTLIEVILDGENFIRNVEVTVIRAGANLPPAATASTSAIPPITRLPDLVPSVPSAPATPAAAARPAIAAAAPRVEPAPSVLPKVTRLAPAAPAEPVIKILPLPEEQPAPVAPPPKVLPSAPAVASVPAPSVAKKPEPAISSPPPKPEVKPSVAAYTPPTPPKPEPKVERQVTPTTSVPASTYVVTTSQAPVNQTPEPSQHSQLPSISLNVNTQQIMNFPRAIQSISLTNEQVAQAKVQGSRLIIEAMQPGNTSLDIQLSGDSTTRSMEIQVSHSRLRP